MAEDRKVLGVIPARWGSTRLPGKSLVSISGKPMIQWVVESAARAEGLDELIVATDDRRIADVVEGLGVKAVMTRPDHPSGTDRVAEAASGSDAGIIINIQGDEPLIDHGLITRLADRMSEGSGDWDMATAAVPLTEESDIENPSVVKVVWDARGRAIYFSRSVIPHDRDRDPGNRVAYWRHIGIYAYTKDFLSKLVNTEPTPLECAEKLEQLRALHIGGAIAVIQAEEHGAGVDTEDDVLNVERLLRQMHG